MKTIMFALALLALLPSTLSAHASAQQTLRVDRPEKGQGARITHVRLLSGVVTHRIRAVVLTDNRCNPDNHGVSHCLNRMRLADGRVLLAVHDHRMMNMPCLSPGEHVLLTPRR